MPLENALIEEVVWSIGYGSCYHTLGCNSESSDSHIGF